MSRVDDDGVFPFSRDRFVRQPLFRIGTALVAALTLPGCMMTRQVVHRPEPGVAYRGVVFVLDGAGGFQATSNALRTALQEEGVPLWVEAVDWSHGFGRVLADQIDQDHTRCAGQHLACRIAAYRQQYPGAEIHLMGHSAGTAVVLAAAEALPPDTLNHVVLLAPAVSAHYDLRPTLRSARNGIDVFFSGRDRGFLGLWTSLIGTADRRWQPAAGRVGFQPQGVNPEDFVLFSRLRQHPWHPCLSWTGNQGGHYGSYKDGFLHAYVVPLLTGKYE